MGHQGTTCSSGCSRVLLSLVRGANLDCQSDWYGKEVLVRRKSVSNAWPIRRTNEERHVIEKGVVCYGYWLFVDIPVPRNCRAGVCLRYSRETRTVSNPGEHLLYSTVAQTAIWAEIILLRGRLREKYICHKALLHRNEGAVILGVLQPVVPLEYCQYIVSTRFARISGRSNWGDAQRELIKCNLEMETWILLDFEQKLH